MVREFLFLYHFKHVFLNKNAIAYNNTIINMPYATPPDLSEDYRLNIDQFYPNIIYFFAQYDVYGHMLTDGIVASLVDIPKEIYEKSYVSSRYNYKYLREYLDLLNITCKGVVTLKDTFVQCDNVYVIKCNEHLNGMLLSARDLRDKMYDVLNLTNFEPKLGAFLNRIYRVRRYVDNMGDFINLTQERHKDIQFIEIKNEEVYGGVKDMFNLMSKVKYFITPAGSSAFNMFYMRSNTGCFIIGSNLDDWADYGLAHAYNIWLAYCSNSNLDHYNLVDNQSIDLQRNMLYLDRVIYAVENSKWPSECYKDKTVEIYFNLDMTRKIMEKNPYLSYTVYDDEKSFLQQLH